ncbi:chorismate synthase, partial [Limosilactobacillus fermentum]
IGPVDTDLTKPQMVSEIKDAITQNDLRILAQDRVAELHDLIDQTRRAGDTLGGWIRVVVNGMPAGIGSYVSWDTKLDGQLAAAVMGVNAMKGVSIGDSFEISRHPGSQGMDEISHDA